MPKMSKTPIKYSNDVDHYNALKACQYKYIKNNNALNKPILIHARTTLAMPHKTKTA